MLRTLGLVFASLVAALALLATPAAAKPFPETGYSITNDRILDYFEHRGGVRTLGYPISREFDFLGTRVQFFQRAVLQLRADGSVGLLNLLDEGLLPYTHINGSTFPAINPVVVSAAPSPSDAGYAAKALDFVRANAPDEWEGLKTNFYSTFLNTVTYEEAFPQGDVDPGLLPLINLEIWGLPTSRPTYDENNGNFVYLRFQRGIMHFDKTSGLTQGILLGDYLKSVLTGHNLPADLEAQAAGSRLYRQYDNGKLAGLARPDELPATNLFAAFEKDGVVVPAPQPTATPVPPTPRPIATPVAQPPASIEVSGSAKWVEQVQGALNLLATKSPYNYSLVRQNVYRIVEEPVTPSATSHTLHAERALKIVEWHAFTPDWGKYPNHQMEWLAGLIVHNAVHIDQYHRGVNVSTAEADLEALTRQEDALAAVETNWPTGQFTSFVHDAMVNNTGWWSNWQQPRAPSADQTQ